MLQLSLAAKDPEGRFHIISKDTGFDTLIQHLKGRKVNVQREKDLAEIPELRMSKTATDEEKFAAIVKDLAGRGQSRPRKLKTLSNTINTLFTRKLEEPELASLIEQLKQLRYITVQEGRVSYNLSR